MFLVYFFTLSAGHDAEVIRGGLAEVLKVLLTVGMPLPVAVF